MRRHRISSPPASSVEGRAAHRPRPRDAGPNIPAPLRRDRATSGRPTDRSPLARSGRLAQKGETAMRKRPFGRFVLLAPGLLASAALALVGAGRAAASDAPAETRTVQ